MLKNHFKILRALCGSIFLFGFMLFFKANRRSEKVKFLAQTVFDITQIRKMKSAFTACAAGGKNDKHRRAQTGLSNILNVQTNIAA